MLKLRKDQPLDPKCAGGIFPSLTKRQFFHPTFTCIRRLQTSEQFSLLAWSRGQHSPTTQATTCCDSQPHISAWISGGPVPRLLLACTASFMLLTFPRNSKWQNRRYCNLELLTFVNWWEYWNVHVPYLTAPPAFLICCSAQPFRICIRQLTSGLNIY